MAKTDVTFFKPFVDGTLLTLKVQCNLDAKAGKPFIKEPNPPDTYDIAGIIGVSSSTFSGTITLCFPKKVFLTLMNNMLGESHNEISKELEDGAAELLNIIFGQAKKVLNTNGHEIQKAIPTVISGIALKTRHMTQSHTIVLPFETQSGPFFIEIAAEGASLS